MSAIKSCLKNAGNARQAKSTMKQHGYFNNQKMCETLQGSIWSSTQPNTQSPVVIKVTNKKLHRESVVEINGKRYYVQENILKERAILKYLTKNPKAPKSIVKYIDFFADKENFYLVMEHGGHSLFDFAVKVHDCLKNKKIEVSEWIKVVHLLFKQMVTAVEYMHSLNVANFDISMENMLINDVDVCIDAQNHLQFVIDDMQNPIQLKLCDLGLSELFPYNSNDGNKKVNDICNKYVGKHNYKSPEIVSKKKTFSAMSNDVWCLGVTLFMMVIGGCPWKRAELSDEHFELIMNGQIRKVIAKWGRDDYVTDELIDLFNQMFKYESERITLGELKEHPWLKQNL